MNDQLTAKFLIERCVPADELKTNFRINFSRFSMSDYHKIRTDEVLSYFFYLTTFGKVLIGSTSVGICYLHFVLDEAKAEKDFNYFSLIVLWLKKNLNNTRLR